MSQPVSEPAAVPRLRRRRRPVRFGVGIWALVVALVALIVLTFLPTGYVIQRPGPVFDTLGEVQDAEGTRVPLIEVSGAETYPTTGTLDLTTVQLIGGPSRTPSWADLALAWFDPSRAVVPLEAVFPPGETGKQREERNAVLMVDSQQEATAAALAELGYDIGAKVEAVEAVPGTPAEGVLEGGDVILAVDGEKVASAELLRARIQKSEGAEVQLTVARGGAERTVAITPEKQEVNGVSTWLIGITLRTTFDFPIDVTIQLDNVGGPSAGMMFALGIIDVLTPGELTGGHRIAGTGTISSTGAVGPIGGIRQKLYGARDDDAEIFLAPTSNCDEVAGHVPNGLTVYSTATLDESLHILDVIAQGGDVSALPTCAAS